MSAHITYVGQEYWKIASRVNRHRGNKRIIPLAVFELRRLATPSQAVKSRVQSFLSKHQGYPPSISPNGDGGDVA